MASAKGTKAAEASATRRALVIAIAGLKGGVGKSTIAMNVAACLHRAGTRALIVDADSQGTLQAWAARASEEKHDGPPVISMAPAAIARDLERVAQGFEVVLVDTPARLGREARAAMLAADLVVLPVTPGGADVWALNETIEVLRDAQALRPDLRGTVVLNRTDRTNLASVTSKALEELGVPVLERVVRSRVAFGEALLAGQGVVDYAPESAAADEVAALTRALLKSVEA